MPRTPAFAAATMTFARGLQVDNWWEIGVPDPDAVALVRAVAYYRHSAQDRQENSIPIQQDQVSSPQFLYHRRYNFRCCRIAVLVGHRQGIGLVHFFPKLVVQEPVSEELERRPRARPATLLQNRHISPTDSAEEPNVEMVWHADRFAEILFCALVARLPMQGLLIAWVWWAAVKKVGTTDE